VTDLTNLEERKSIMDTLAAEIKVCTKCPLYQGRTNAVPGAGPIDSDIMFIGEGPGYNEDKKGLPFVGQSGHLLEEFLGIIGMTRDQVFISNVVKCRPPENRDPEPFEVETCTSNYLFKQIETINPKVIVTLGRFSMGLFFPKAKITQIHGQHKFENGRYFLPLFHPAAILRNMAMKPAAIDDFKKIPKLVADWYAKSGGAPSIMSDSTAASNRIDAAKPDNGKDAQTKPTQLSLF
jgi:uracil-DNA glycosylase